MTITNFLCKKKSFIGLEHKITHDRFIYFIFAYIFEYKYVFSQQTESKLPCVEGAPISTEATTKAPSSTASSTTSRTPTPPWTFLNSKVTKQLQPSDPPH